MFLSLPIYELQALRLLVRLYEQAPILHRASVEQKLIRRIKYLQRRPVYVWVKTDDVSTFLFLHRTNIDTYIV